MSRSVNGEVLIRKQEWRTGFERLHRGNFLNKQSFAKSSADYLILLLLNTLAASLIWGLNTLFLLDGGLNNTEAFAANAFFTVGITIFEIPTGVLADMRGRRMSYLLGMITLIISTLLYFLMWYYRLLSGRGRRLGVARARLYILLGCDRSMVGRCVGLQRNYKEALESVIAKGEIVEGVAMLTGSVAGGIVAQATNLGVPYQFRAVTRAQFRSRSRVNERSRLQAGRREESDQGGEDDYRRFGSTWAGQSAGAMDHAGRAVHRWRESFTRSMRCNLTCSSCVEMNGRTASPDWRRQSSRGRKSPAGYSCRMSDGFFRRRTTVLLICQLVSVLVLATVGFVPNFWVAVTLLILWGLMFSATMPVRQTYLNGLIPSEQRATVLSFDSVFSSSGGVVFQPLLGKAADVWSYPVSYIFSAAIQALAIPFTWLARHEKALSDAIRSANGKKGET